MSLHFSSTENRALKILFSDEVIDLDDLSRDELRAQVIEVLETKRQEDPSRHLMWSVIARDLRQLLDNRVLH